MKKVYVKEGRYVYAYLVPAGKSYRSAIIIMAAYNQEEAERKLQAAIDKAPPKYRRLIEAEGIEE